MVFLRPSFFFKIQRGMFMSIPRQHTVVRHLSSKSPKEAYELKVKEGKWRPDPHQEKAVFAVNRLYHDLQSYNQPPVPKESFYLPSRGNEGSTWLSRFRSTLSKCASSFKPSSFIAPQIPRGIYLYGDVGCGKTALMDLFYTNLPSNVTRSKRIHFHAFMLHIHQSAHQLKQVYGYGVDTIEYLSAQLASKCTVLCFDELQVTDVAGALILRRLFECLQKYGVVIFITSNRAPDDLYKNGIQRESFIPCIHLLNESLNVMCLDSPNDYRRLQTQTDDVYLYPAKDTKVRQKVQNFFERYGDLHADPTHEVQLEVFGRTILVPKVSKDTAWFTFRELCGEPKSAADYISLANRFKVFIISDIPQLSIEAKDLIRRFINFIDAAYDARAKIILSADVSVDLIYPTPEGYKHLQTTKNYSESIENSMIAPESNYHGDFGGVEEVFAFSRCLSRLAEMRRSDWLQP
ncbi:AFG1 family mitochondrial ATPase/chaperone Afg1 [Schizosaccharomyces osmophilus]|uniref:AFG1 family mitochondrial ATPase/chaperone Afg1 n=1 Tax=Schizosaccharomyces osmophilus TaxID=2545709 RepID=A0AAF0AUA7_9SCHI|nr:AFG1 family mitochondrial ATPase/chaperone Afg1 [Schizosaccharomyces osmophilus]WBW71178.1 AFG1 family mitochondrial ATPase/chaperone Afg1 [Schizosaccharomyces osmophilus]